MPLIPQIIAQGPSNLRVGVPDAPRIPLDNPADSAMAEFGQKISAIGDALDRQQTMLDAANVMNAYRTRVTQARIGAAQQDPVVQASYFRANTDPGDIFKDPANAHILPLLQEHLPEIQNAGLQDVLLHQQQAREQQQRGQLDGFLKTGPVNYLNAPDPRQAAGIVATRDTLLDQAQSTGMIQPNERAALVHQWDNDVQVGQLRAQAVSDPSGAMTELSRPDFLQRHPAVTAEQWQALRSDAVSQSQFADRQIDASMKADQAQTEQGIMQAAANGQPIGPALENARAHDLVSDEFYRRYAGHAFRDNMPSAPGLEDALQQQIKDATPDTIDSTMENMKFAIAAGTLNPKNGSALMFMATRRKADLQQGQKADAAQAKADILNDFYPPKSKLDGMASINERTLLRDLLDSYWDAALLRNKGDAQKAKQETEDHFHGFLKTKPVGPGGSLTRLLNAGP